MKVVIYGPMACGKTRHAGTIARHFHLRRVVDGWDPATDRLEHGALHLTTTPCEGIRGARVISYDSLPSKLRCDPQSARDAGCEVLRPRSLRDDDPEQVL